MMSFDKDRKLLIVSGAVSGTLGVYEVGGLFMGCRHVPPPTTQTPQTPPV